MRESLCMHTVMSSRGRITEGSEKAAAVNVLLPGEHRRQVVRNAADIAADLIREAIVEGRLHPGEPLREERLATDLGISRTPIREALLILQTEGLVEAAPKRGSVVRSYGPREIADLYETRAMVEGYAAGRAAKLVTESGLEALRTSCIRFEQLIDEGDVVSLVGENLAFHNVIIEAADSPSLGYVIRFVTRVPLIYRGYYWYSPKAKLIALHYHQRITQTLEKRDAARAESLMREHIFEALDVLSAHLADLAAGDVETEPPGSA
jgi:DNA-binding GntR family transcriptional regulator